MHLLITDSGVGGLSVCAFAEEFLRTHDIGEPVRLTYVNASPENDFGYNSMASRKEKLDNFDRFLHIIAEKYSPDLIYVACNTLSVLMADTEFAKNTTLPMRGIVETGVNLLVRDLRKFPDSTVAIFGTETTINEQTYSDLLKMNGIDESRIVAQACPSLADTISEDLRGLDAQAKIKEYVCEAVRKSLHPKTRHLTYLACTHYGYRKDLFFAAFEEHEVHTQIFNPNEIVVEDLFVSSGLYEIKSGQESAVDMEFVARYRIPETALETISFFLGGIAPRTIQAFTNYTYVPELF
jgi:glutamate racemase